MHISDEKIGIAACRPLTCSVVFGLLLSLVLRMEVSGHMAFTVTINRW